MKLGEGRAEGAENEVSNTSWKKGLTGDPTPPSLLWDLGERRDWPVLTG